MPLTRHQAERSYFQANTRLDVLAHELADTTDPDLRGRLCAKMAVAEYDMARYHDTAFGRSRADDAAQSHRYSGFLLQLIADVELAVAYPNRGRRRTDSDFEPAVGRILDEMAAADDLPVRMRRLEVLYTAVVDRVGGDAAETIACLPAPGFDGWVERTEGQELATAVTRRSASLIAAVFAAVALGVGMYAYLTNHPVVCGVAAVAAVLPPLLLAHRRANTRRILAAVNDTTDVDAPGTDLAVKT